MPAKPKDPATLAAAVSMEACLKTQHQDEK
jgi:hypothetical protein